MRDYFNSNSYSKPLGLYSYQRKGKIIEKYLSHIIVVTPSVHINNMSHSIPHQ